jgi:hypothetical protein
VYRLIDRLVLLRTFERNLKHVPLGKPIHHVRLHYSKEDDAWMDSSLPVDAAEIAQIIGNQDEIVADCIRRNVMILATAKANASRMKRVEPPSMRHFYKLGGQIFVD